MAEDYYTTLEIRRDASPEEIQSAYRKLARKYHPDLNPDDKQAKQNFQEVQNAFDVLNDTNKREMYDRYGSAYESVGQGRAGESPWAGAGGGPNVDINFEDLFGGQSGGGFSDIFKQFTQRGQQPRRPAAPTRGANLEHELTVPFTTAVLGGEAQIAIQRGDGTTETMQVKIPLGIEDGKKIRLRGQGQPSPNGGPAGDVLIKIITTPHPYFRRQGKRLDVRVPITISEAIEGAKIDVPTPHGTITLSVPPGSSSGRKLRVKGQGVKTASGESGDLFAELQIVLPETVSEEDREQLQSILKKYPENPRAELRW